VTVAGCIQLKNYNERVRSADGANASEMTPCRVLAAGGANHSMERNPRFARTPFHSALGIKNARCAAFFTARVPLISLALYGLTIQTILKRRDFMAELTVFHSGNPN